MFLRSNKSIFRSTLRRLPNAVAMVEGKSVGNDINGVVEFYQTADGVWVLADFVGLPTPDEKCESRVFAFHIHNGTECTGNSQDPFSDAGTHYNPNGCLHPYHAGDMPPLFGNANGRAFLVFLTDRFTVDEIIGKAVIVHSRPDDFTSQPSGNSGNKIACGIISELSR